MYSNGLNSKYTILLIEDNQDDVFLIKRAFKKANILNPIQVIEDGEKAIEYINKICTDINNLSKVPILILLDLKLPKKSGFEVLEHIKRKSLIKRIPVVILTSSKESPDINKAYDLGANSYLVKPVIFEDLLSLMKTLGFYWIVLNQKPEVFNGGD